ncbi:Hypothetical predicted protein [Prunus dulcis]|uniref:Uncharacterized protein n=1 Tax=Prunus dulcis TaxID=3755 RepID=A0A5E4FH26_PRUDU|nr:hypothetical protein L3X38_022783 [Prunus dulcis]VVA27463.1 Hypothetical predicted protein [Prunus dulcis]
MDQPPKGTTSALGGPHKSTLAPRTCSEWISLCHVPCPPGPTRAAPAAVAVANSLNLLEKPSVGVIWRLDCSRAYVAAPGRPQSANCCVADAHNGTKEKTDTVNDSALVLRICPWGIVGITD